MLTKASSKSNFWFVDSGCTEHMIDNKLFFTTYQDVSMERRPVQGIGSAMLTVAGVGGILIKIQYDQGYTFGILKGVNYVPSLGYNLFSSYIATQKKIYTLHIDIGCQLLKADKVVMIGYIHNKLYKLNIEVVYLEAVLAATSTVSFRVPTTIES